MFLVIGVENVILVEIKRETESSESKVRVTCIYSTGRKRTTRNNDEQEYCERDHKLTADRIGYMFSTDLMEASSMLPSNISRVKELMKVGNSTLSRPSIRSL
jgi:hypothetical protein